MFKMSSTSIHVLFQLVSEPRDIVKLDLRKIVLHLSKRTYQSTSVLHEPPPPRRDRLTEESVDKVQTDDSRNKPDNHAVRDATVTNVVRQARNEHGKKFQVTKIPRHFTGLDSQQRHTHTNSKSINQSITHSFIHSLFESNHMVPYGLTER